MDTFFAVTSHMMKNIGAGLGKAFGVTTFLLGSVAGFFIVLITILFCNSSNKRSFVNKNKKLIIIVFIIELVFVWFSRDIKILKAGVTLLLVCGFVIGIKSVGKIKKSNATQKRARNVKK